MAQSTMGVRLDEQTQKRLKKLSEQRDRSPHYLMKEAIEIYLRREEDLEAEKTLTRERWQHFELTGEALSQDDMFKWAASLQSDI